jgi:hypothetical protein
MNIPPQQSAVTYQEHVAAALSRWLPMRTRSAFDQLASLLGRRMGQEANDGLVGPSTTADELLVKATWLRIFEVHDATVNIRSLEGRLLSGLFYNNRWRPLFEREDSARAFVFMAVRFLCNGEMNGEINQSVAAQLEFAMADWFEPIETRDPDHCRAIAGALFGNAWCTFVYDERKRGTSLLTLLKEGWPSFLPGRLSLGAEPSSPGLPALDC